MIVGEGVGVISIRCVDGPLPPVLASTSIDEAGLINSSVLNAWNIKQSETVTSRVIKTLLLDSFLFEYRPFKSLLGLYLFIVGILYWHK